MSSKKKNSYRSENLTVSFFNIDYIHKMDITGDLILVMRSGNKKGLEKADYDRLSKEYDEWCESKPEGGKDE